MAEEKQPWPITGDDLAPIRRVRIELQEGDDFVTLEVQVANVNDLALGEPSLDAFGNARLTIVVQGQQLYIAKHTRPDPIAAADERPPILPIEPDFNPRNN